MIMRPDDKLTRIGVFYDGGYFAAVSDYYRFCHRRKERLSVGGIHCFVKHKVAEVEAVDERYCQVVDAHYFRGRFSAIETQEHEKLFADRVFDDVLMHAGVITHYLPRSPRGEKGVDVWFALEAFELAVYKGFNILVLVACDGDYLPLVRKVNTLGTRVMLLAWDFTATDASGRTQDTRVAQLLLNEVTYPVQMHALIDDRALRNDPVIEALFVPRSDEDEEVERGQPTNALPTASTMLPAIIGDKRSGKVKNIPEGKTFGFITDDEPGQQVWFFNATNVEQPGFPGLKAGDRVQFILAENPRGGLWAVEIHKKE